MPDGVLLPMLQAEKLSDFVIRLSDGAFASTHFRESGKPKGPAILHLLLADH